MSEQPSGADLIELREALNMQSAEFAAVVLGNKGTRKTLNRWVRRLEAMPSIPPKVEERIRGYLAEKWPNARPRHPGQA